VRYQEIQDEYLNSGRTPQDRPDPNQRGWRLANRVYFQSKTLIGKQEERSLIHDHIKRFAIVQLLYLSLRIRLTKFKQKGTEVQYE
jgi:hypothetical protein